MPRAVTATLRNPIVLSRCCALSGDTSERQHKETYGLELRCRATAVVASKHLQNMAATQRTGSGPLRQEPPRPKRVLQRCCGSGIEHALKPALRGRRVRHPRPSQSTRRLDARRKARLCSAASQANRDTDALLLLLRRHPRKPNQSKRIRQRRRNQLSHHPHQLHSLKQPMDNDIGIVEPPPQLVQNSSSTAAMI